MENKNPGDKTVATLLENIVIAPNNAGDPIVIRDRGLARLLRKETGNLNWEANNKRIESTESVDVVEFISNGLVFSASLPKVKGGIITVSQDHDIISNSFHGHSKTRPKTGPAGRAYTLAQALEFIDKSTPEWLPAAMDMQAATW